MQPLILSGLSTSLQAIAENLTPKPTIEISKKNSIAFSYRARTFIVHRTDKRGVRSEKTFKTKGPKHDGIILTITLLKEKWTGAGELPSTTHGPYWTTHINAVSDVKIKLFLHYKIQYGRNTKKELKDKIFNLLKQTTGKETQEIERFANSHKHLGELVAKAMDEKNFEKIKSLAAPLELIKDLEKSEETHKKYLEYCDSLPELAKKYHSFLKSKGHPPLSEMEVKKFIANRKKEVNGKIFEFSTGVRFQSKDGKVVIELIDQAIAINGKWYLLRLCPGGIEELMEKESSK